MSRHSHRGQHQLSAVVLLAVAIGSGCGGSTTTSSSEVSLSPTGEVGLEVARGAGCAACHGSNGEGVEGLGPSFVGLPGTQVLLDDGSRVLADRSYLRLSITEPDAAIVDGYGLPMPPYDLPTEDLEAILDYLMELS